MPKLLVLQHAAREVLGTLDPLLRSEGFRIRYVNFARHPDARPALDGYDGLIVLGGPMNVDETDVHPHLLHELAVRREALERGCPVLGICLGEPGYPKVDQATSKITTRADLGRPGVITRGTRCAARGRVTAEGGEG